MSAGGKPNDVDLGTGTDPEFAITDQPASLPTVAPGASFTVDVTYTADDAEFDTGTLEVSHDGSGSPVVVPLDGEGVSNIPMSFGQSLLGGEIPFPTRRRWTSVPTGGSTSPSRTATSSPTASCGTGRAATTSPG